MPKHRLHRFISRKFLGKPYSEVHRAIDQPYIFLGRRHRRIFHSPDEAYLMGLLASEGDPRGGDAGLLHAWLDQECSENKNSKKWLEFMAKQEEVNEKQMRLLKKIMNPEYGHRVKRKRRTRTQDSLF